MPTEFRLVEAPRRARGRRRWARRLAPLTAALFASAALAGPGVSSTKFSDMPAGAYVSDQAHTSVTA
jgi:hypothetical protein